MHSLDDRLKTPVYTTAQVRELDRLIITEYGISSFELMNRAARALLACIREHWPDRKRLLLFCGGGNNGGDGYLLGSLALQAGWSVQAIALAAPEQLSSDARRAFESFRQEPGQVLSWQAYQSIPDNPGTDTVMVDALLGTGLSRAAEGPFAETIRYINRHAGPVLAVDTPSGLNTDTGIPAGPAVIADRTLTFIGMKSGLLTGQARNHTGTLQLAPLITDPEPFKRIPSDSWLIEKDYLTIRLPPRQRTAHKGDFGHALLLGGVRGMSGAIRLAGAAALRTGCGRVSIATDTAHADWINLSQPELMVHGIDTAGSLRLLLEGKTVLGLGPGLGQSDWAHRLFRLVINSPLPLVVDADGLNLLAKAPIRRPDWVLTPHPGEAARLLGWSTAQVENDRVRAVRCLQQKLGGIIVLKGAGTLIGTPTETVFCQRGNPGMASGGMGDVLCGIITALIAQGRTQEEAAILGVELHAGAADLAARQGERGLLAGDVIDNIRTMINPQPHHR
ncbi:MAG: NAD(P)H-hydrate dehydratase [Thiothrix sp.]|nr:NAD(P)H-hydrate dehydratase [Thiothrix sp.]